jgi:hypothetical protein
LQGFGVEVKERIVDLVADNWDAILFTSSYSATDLIGITKTSE